MKLGKCQHHYLIKYETVLYKHIFTRAQSFRQSYFIKRVVVNIKGSQELRLICDVNDV